MDRAGNRQSNNSSIDCEAEYRKPTPSAASLNQDVYDACFRDVEKSVFVPLMKYGQTYYDSAGRTAAPATPLKSNDETTRLYMDARKSMGRVSTPNGMKGSGFFVSEDGLFATDYHVVREEANVRVSVDDGTTRKAKVVAKQASDDVALLEVEKLHPAEKFKALSFRPITDKDVKNGAQTLACGFGYSPVLHCSPGRINSYIYQREIPLDPPAPYLSPNRLLVTSSQHSSLGDSGGPVFFRKDGKVGMLVDMTNSDMKTMVGTPIQRMIELMQVQRKFQSPVSNQPR